MDQVTLFINVLIGMFAGLISASVGYISNKELEKIDGYKLGKTIVIGLIIGGIAGFYDISYLDAQIKLGAFAILTTFIDEVVKVIVRRSGLGAWLEKNKKTIKEVSNIADGSAPNDLIGKIKISGEEE